MESIYTARLGCTRCPISPFQLGKGFKEGFKWPAPLKSVYKLNPFVEQASIKSFQPKERFHFVEQRYFYVQKVKQNEAKLKYRQPYKNIANGEAAREIGNVQMHTLGPYRQTEQHRNSIPCQRRCYVHFVLSCRSVAPTTQTPAGFTWPLQTTTRSISFH